MQTAARIHCWRAAALAVLALLPLGCIADDVQVIAHRGASAEAPEHTFAAWDLALAQGADWIEQDLQMTRDGQLVVLHDGALDRTARGPTVQCSGLVRDKTRSQLAGCDVGSWFNTEHPALARPEFAAARIATLDEVLTRYAGRARFYIETKNPAEAPGMEDSLLAVLRRHRLVGRGGDEGRVLVQSFSPASLERLHARGLVVHPYTVNAESAMTYLIGLGVDGMFTDRPAALRQALGR